MNFILLCSRSDIRGAERLSTRRPGRRDVLGIWHYLSFLLLSLFLIFKKCLSYVCLLRVDTRWLDWVGDRELVVLEHQVILHLCHTTPSNCLPASAHIFSSVSLQKPRDRCSWLGVSGPHSLRPGLQWGSLPGRACQRTCRGVVK